MPRFFPRFLGQHPGLCRCPCQCQMPGSECQITISSSTCRGGIISSMPAPFPFPCGWKTRSCVTWLSSPSLSLTVHLSPDANCFSWSFVFAPLSRVRVALEEFLAQQIITYTYVWPGYYLLVWVTPIISQLNRLKVRSKKKGRGNGVRGHNFVTAKWAGSNLWASSSEFPEGRGSWYLGFTPSPTYAIAAWCWANMFYLSINEQRRAPMPRFMQILNWFSRTIGPLINHLSDQEQSNQVICEPNRHRKKPMHTACFKWQQTILIQSHQLGQRRPQNV